MVRIMKIFSISKILVLVLLLFASQLYCTEKNQDISDKVRQEISEHFSLSQSYTCDQSCHNESGVCGLRRKIASAVKSEINSQIYNTMHRNAKTRVYDKGLAKHLPDIPFIYKVPTWPVQSLFFMKKDALSVWVSGEWANQSYGSSGGTKDVSQLVFREPLIRVKDILLASKLIDKGLAVPVSAGYEFLRTLKDQTLSFNASMNKQELAFSYVRHFLRGDISLGLNVPIVREHHKIRLTSELTPQQNEILRSGSSKFFEFYPNGLSDFFEKGILAKKGISFNQNDTEVGLGDISAFFNYEVTTRHCERCFFGISALFPTSRQRDVYKLWDPDLGKSHAELSLFGSFLFSKYRFFNPHVFVQVSFQLPRKVMRRVPWRRRTQDITRLTSSRYGEDFTPYGDSIKRIGSSFPTFSETDVDVRRFSDTASKIKLRPGGEIFLRIGNMLTRMFTERMFLDIFYDVRMRGRDYTGYRHEDEIYRPSVITDNTFQTAHRLGLNFSYQFDDAWRWHVGGLYSFAGRNILKTYEINSVLTWEF